MAVDDVTTAINKRKVFDSSFIVISLLDFVGYVCNSGGDVAKLKNETKDIMAERREEAKQKEDSGVKRKESVRKKILHSPTNYLDYMIFR